MWEHQIQTILLFMSIRSVCFLFVCLFVVVVVIDIVVKRSQLGTAVGWFGRGIAILDPSPLLCWMLIPKGKYLSAFFNVEKRVKADDIRWHQMMRYYLFNVHGHCALCREGTATINEDPLINLKNKVKMLLLCESSKKENKN